MVVKVLKIVVGSALTLLGCGFAFIAVDSARVGSVLFFGASGASLFASGLIVVNDGVRKQRR